jgi:hypothetical protein
MRTFQVCALTKNGEPAFSEELRAHSPEAAKLQAEGMFAMFDVIEVWEGQELIVRIRRSDPLQTD